MPTETLRRLAWVLYDAANSGFGLIVLGPVFVPAFIGLLPEQHDWPLLDGRVPTGLNVWGVAVPGSGVVAILTAIVALLIVLLAPVLGALADGRGWQRRLFVGFGVAGGTVALGLYFVGPQSWLLGAVLYVASFTCFGLANQFYNAYLPHLAPPERQGSLSGWGFAVGYLGGAAGMLLGWWLLEGPTLWAFGGVWWLLLALPSYVLMPHVPPSNPDAPRHGLLADAFGRIAHTFRQVRPYRTLFLFLLAFLLYTNGTETIINLSSAYGEEVIGMTAAQLIRMFLVVQVVAFVGALACGYLADWIGNKPVIVATLAVWCVGSAGMFVIRGPVGFTVLACVIGVVLGGVQSSSRALMARLAPAEIRNEAFGFFAIGSKALAIFGPLLYAGLTMLAGPRFGIFAVLPFLVGGLLLLRWVREPAV